MKLDNHDKEKLNAMPLDELQALAAPMLEALKAKKLAALKESRKAKRKAYDKSRRAKTVAVTIRFGDKASAEAVRAIVKQWKAAANLNGRTVADEVAAAKARLPSGTRRARGSAKPASVLSSSPASNVGKPAAASHKTSDERR